MTVANLRTAAGKDPHDKGLHDLVGELSTRSDDFRRRWGAHNVRTHGTGVKQFHHHVVGDLTLAYESMDLRAEPGPHPDHLRRRARLANRPCAHAAGLLGRYQQRHGPFDVASLALGGDEPGLAPTHRDVPDLLASASRQGRRTRL